MKLKWVKVPDGMNIFRAETVRYRYIMVAPPRSEVHLWVQHSVSEWATAPIAERMCRTRRSAERVAQRFENEARTPHRLR